MPLTPEQIAEQAAAHDKAEIDAKPVRAFSQDRAMDLDDAYAVQDAWVARKVARGRHVIGRKVGLTSRAMQQAMQIGEPDFGTLLDDMLFQSGDTLPAADFIDPRLEVEWTFVLKRDLSGDDLSVDDVMDATDYILPSLELIAARSHRIDPETGYMRLVTDTISDNAANAGIIVGTEPIAPDAIDLRWAGSILYRKGIVEETGLGAGVMDHPAEGLVWLAKRFAPHGIKLEAGQYLMSGSFTRPVMARAGDHFLADFGRYGSVELGFS
ncbi:2-oxo-hept-4-ene-1,7-dioate hydratase [Algimonas porphyrae]|uniref:2-oxo-hepta-3-ene-1,7-dioic acid hydratase n=1 Tax=Algimonas porphyrae TaxID=1128113 RepID=A0ABQ5V498_9PROT|nr:2-oxo-hepta-3-ene-1,7-dioic acid hydratase [Algimonas porphyrae]GLQ21539.1 2-oxo-hepta-3-ene-1,7-dioic acid hydratase [Algimonas porphyrae]